MKQEEWKRYYKQAKHALESAIRDQDAEDYEWSCFKAHQAAELIVKGFIRSSDSFITGHSLLKLFYYLKQSYSILRQLIKWATNLEIHIEPSFNMRSS